MICAELAIFNLFQLIKMYLFILFHSSHRKKQDNVIGQNNVYKYYFCYPFFSYTKDRILHLFIFHLHVECSIHKTHENYI